MSKHRTEHRPLEGVHPGLSRRAWRGEEAFIPETIEQAIELATRLVEEAGAGRAQADALVLWLARRAYAGEDTIAPDVRSSYRKLLGRLEPQSLTPPPKGRRSLSAAKPAPRPPGPTPGPGASGGGGVMAGTRIHRLPPPIRCRVRGEQLYFGVDRLTLVLPVAVDRKSIAHARLRYRVLRRRHDAQTARDQVLAMHVTRWLAELLSDALAVPA